MNVNWGVGKRVFLTLWTMAIRSDMVASFEQKMSSKVLNSIFSRVGRSTILRRLFLATMCNHVIE